jgi:outer membrane protein assembly factor BamA
LSFEHGRAVHFLSEPGPASLPHHPVLNSGALIGLEFQHVNSNRTRLLSVAGGTALLLLFATLAPAQARKPSKPLPPSAFKLVSIKVTGTRRFSPEEIVAASGLQLGQIVSEDDFKRVSQHLGETGAFSDVAYAFHFSSEGTKLELQLADSDPFVPAHFDNFVWFSDKELLDGLRAQVPLFQGALPVGGDLAEQVSNALQALLFERKIDGHVDYLRTGPEEGPISSFAFSISGHSIRIRNVDFTGAGPAELPLLQTAAKKISGQEFLRSSLRVQADKDLLPVYLALGYLKAAFADAQPKVVQDSPQETLVDVNFNVDTGRQYKVSEMQLTGYKAFPVEKLRVLIHQQLGQPANANQLKSDLEAIKKLYGTRGYMAASVLATPEIDDDQSTVKYQISIDEGTVFTMGDLDIRGLDKRDTNRLFTEWKLLTGDPYDSGYPQRFVQQSAKDLGEWKISIHESLNDKEKTVDVTLRFEPNPR